METIELLALPHEGFDLDLYALMPELRERLEHEFGPGAPLVVRHEAKRGLYSVANLLEHRRLHPADGRAQNQARRQRLVHLLRPFVQRRSDYAEPRIGHPLPVGPGLWMFGRYGESHQLADRGIHAPARHPLPHPGLGQAERARIRRPAPRRPGSGPSNSQPE